MSRSGKQNELAMGAKSLSIKRPQSCYRGELSVGVEGNSNRLDEVPRNNDGVRAL